MLDAITGQNAISQAREFCKAANATGIILTKLDGTAKGGCVVAVKQRLGLPVRFIGVGEGIDDLIPFTPEAMWKSCCPGSGSIKCRTDLQSDLSGRALARPAPLAGEPSVGVRQGQRGEKHENLCSDRQRR